MAVGQSAFLSYNSYIAVGRETTYGTFLTGTAGLPFLSAAIKTVKEGKILEQVENSRAHSLRIEGGKVVSGDVEFYFYAKELAPNYLLHNAFGGAISTATATAETVGSSAVTHTISIGQMDGSYSSICIDHRKGDSVGAQRFRYNGGRVDSLTITGELDEALKCKASLVFSDSTISAADISTLLTIGASSVPLTFVSGRFNVENSLASLTSTSFWHVQSVEFTLSNNLKADSESRRLGSDILSVLPVGIANFDLKVSMRFDTITAYNAMLNGTQLAAEFEFLGPTLTGSKSREGIKFVFPKVYVNNSGDPEIGGPDEILKADIDFHVLRDETSATGYACRALVTNLTANYT